MQGKILVVKKFAHSSAGPHKLEADPSIAEGRDENSRFCEGVIPIFVNYEIVGLIGTPGEPDVDHEAAAEAVTYYLADVAR